MNLFSLNPRALSDQIIALSYFAIPFALFISAGLRRYLMGRRFRDPGNMTLLIFGIFILSCGIGHQIDAYYVSQSTCAAFTNWKTYWNWVTAASSAAAALVLVPELPVYMLALLKPMDFVRLQKRCTELEQRCVDLERRLDGR